jgi:phage gp29-like protein
MKTFFKREISNPIRALTLERLSAQIDAFQNGHLAEFALTAEAMENRDDMLKNVITKRKKAVTRHGWEILVEDCSDEARAQRDALDFFYRNLTCTHALRPHERGGFQLLIYQMMDAVGKGYAIHEILWKPIIARSAALNPGDTVFNFEDKLNGVEKKEGVQGERKGIMQFSSLADIRFDFSRHRRPIASICE